MFAADQCTRCSGESSACMLGSGPCIHSIPGPAAQHAVAWQAHPCPHVRLSPVEEVLHLLNHPTTANWQACAVQTLGGMLLGKAQHQVQHPPQAAGAAVCCECSGPEASPTVQDRQVLTHGGKHPAAEAAVDVEKAQTQQASSNAPAHCCQGR